MITLRIICNPLDPNSATEEEILSSITILEMVPEWAKNQDAAAVYVNGARIPKSDWDDLFPKDGDEVDVKREVGAGIDVGAALLYAAVSAATSFIVSALFPPPEVSQEADDDASPTYSFRGQRNSRADGSPMEIVFGEIRVPGTIIGQAIDTSNGSVDTFLRLLISYGVGPVFAIGDQVKDTKVALRGDSLPTGLRINGQDARNYDDVESYVRLGLGNENQIPGQGEIRQNYAVGQTLTSPETSGTNINGFTGGYSGAGNDPFNATNDAYWDAWAVRFDITEEVDGYVIRLRFPRGLYEQSNTGGLDATHLGYQIRYVALDGAGQPIRIGGTFPGGGDGDGYVRLQPVGPQAWRRRSAGEFQISGRFIDPAAYTPVGATKALALTGAAADIGTAQPQASQEYQDGEEPDGLSGSVWVRMAGGALSPTNDRDVPLFGSVVGFKGWAFYLSPAFDVVNQRYVYRPTFATEGAQGYTAWASDAFDTFGAIPGRSLSEDDEGKWVHVGFRYQRVSNFVRVHIDGVSIPITLISPGGQRPFAWLDGPLHVGAFPAWTIVDQARRFHGRMDSLVAWDRYINEGEVSQEYGGGVGTNTHPSDPILVYTFNEPAAIESSIRKWWGTLALAGAANSGTQDGIVIDAGLGAEKRGRYRIEVVRTNRTSTSPRVANEVQVLDVQSTIDSDVLYQGIAKQAIQIRASEQLNGTQVQVTQVVKGQLLPVWDGLSETEPTAPDQWSRNPIWAAAFIATSFEFGEGRSYSLADLDLPTWKEAADVCDEVVNDGRRSLAIVSATSELFFSGLTSDATGIRGQLAISMSKTAIGGLPVSWRVGRFVKITGGPGTIDGLLNTLNSPLNRGYEIRQIIETSTVVRLILWWDRTDEIDLYTSNGSLAQALQAQGGSGDWAATLTGGRRRYSFDAVYDTFGNPWESLLRVLSVARAVPIREGKRLRIKQEIPRPAVGLITSASVLENTFTVSYSSYRDHPNSLTANILDADEGYEKVPVGPVFSKRLLDSREFEGVRAETKELFGVTDAGQAANHLRFLLNAYEMLIRRVSFSAGPEAMHYEPGDVLTIGADLLGRGYEGRALENSVIYGAQTIGDWRDLTGARWDRAGVTIAPNQAVTPFGDVATGRLTDSSNSVLGQVSQDFARSIADGLTPGSWCVSMFVRNINSPGSRIELQDSDGWVAGVMDWSSGEFVFDHRPDSMKGGVKAQEVKDGWWFLTVYLWHTPSVKTIPAKLIIQPAFNEVGQSNSVGTIEVADVIAKQGKHGAHVNFKRVAILDDTLQITGEDTLLFRGQSALDNLVSGEVDLTMHPPGLYRRGHTLWLQGDLQDPLLIDNPFIVASESSLLKVQVVKTTLAEDMARTFEAIEYRDEVFDDYVPLEDETGTEVAGLLLGGSTDGQLGSDTAGAESRVPQRLPFIELADELVATPSGPRSMLRVGWPAAYGDADPGDTVKVWARPFGAKDGWDLLGGYAARSGGAEVEIPTALGETLIEVSVQLVSRAGLARGIEGSARDSHRFTGIGPTPAPPTGLRAALVGTRLMVEWALQDAGHGIVARRGGWVLGDPAFGVRPGEPSTGLTHEWARDPFGEGVGELQVAAIDQAGRPSVPVAVPVQGIGVARAESVDSGTPPTRWELAQAGGWYVGPPFDVQGPRVSGGLSKQLDGSLGFSGSIELVGGYQTHGDQATAITDRNGRSLRRVLPQAVVEARQIYPEVPRVIMDDPDRDRWTAEGPIYLTPREKECSLSIEMSVLEDDAVGSEWGPWIRYAPGEIVCIDVRFRLVATRPTAGFDISITRFHTALFVAF